MEIFTAWSIGGKVAEIAFFRWNVRAKGCSPPDQWVALQCRALLSYGLKGGITVQGTVSIRMRGWHHGADWHESVDQEVVGRVF